MASVLHFRTTLPNFTYRRPSSLNELLQLKAELGGEASLLAGGTDLLVDMRSGIRRPKVVVDVKGINELHLLEHTRDRGLVVGASVTLGELGRNELVRFKYPVLYGAIRKLADPSLRERATLAGNIANASPAADSVPPLLVYGAKLELASLRGRRQVPLREFFTGVKKTVMREDEVITKIIIPEPPEGSEGEYFKAVRTSEDLAVVGIAALFANKTEPRERIVRLGFASVAPTPLYMDSVEELFRRDAPINELIKEAIKLVLKEVNPITDVRATKEYRLHLVKYVTAYLLRKYLG